MRLFPHTPASSCDSTKIGTMYYDSAEDQTKVCTKDGWKNIGGGLSFGNWETKAINTTYKAISDGFVVTANISSSGVHYGYTDGNSNPTTLRTVSDSQGDGEGIMMPVRSGDYWRVYQPSPGISSNNVYWLPIVSGS